MAYTRVNWVDFPNTSTPVDAANLNNMDVGISNALTTSTTLDQVAAPAANVALNSKKITGLANGTVASDAAAFGQIPTSIGNVVHGTKTSSVSTSGTTFSGGADLLASVLSFTADGTSDYLVVGSGVGWANGTSGNGMQARLNLDSADGGIIQEIDIGTALAADGLPFSPRGIILAPSAGSHTVNIRVNAVAGGTVTVAAGVGGAGTNGPIVVTIQKA